MCQKLGDDHHKRQEEEWLLFEQRWLEEEQRRFCEEEEERHLPWRIERIRLAKEDNERQTKDRIHLLEEDKKRIKLEIEWERQVEEDERKRKTNSPTERRIRTTKDRGGIETKKKKKYAAPNSLMKKSGNRRAH